MTVKEFMELDAMITDLVIEVRENGKLIDYMAIGLDFGIKPPYPVELKDRTGKKRFGSYFKKSINAWDDGHDYWQSKINNLPKGWADLQIISIETRSVMHSHHPRSYGHPSRSYEGFKLVCLPAGVTLEQETDKQPKKAVTDEQLPGQTNIYDFLGV